VAMTPLVVVMLVICAVMLTQIDSNDPPYPW
jgi:hypothetical protein